MNDSNDKNDDKAMVVIEARFKKDAMDSAEFKEYSVRSNKNGEANGGVVLAKFQVTANLANSNIQSPHLILVIEYPNQAAAHHTFTNSEYQSILPLREAVFEHVNIYTTNQLPI